MSAYYNGLSALVFVIVSVVQGRVSVLQGFVIVGFCHFQRSARACQRTIRVCKRWFYHFQRNAKACLCYIKCVSKETGKFR